MVGETRGIAAGAGELVNGSGESRAEAGKTDDARKIGMGHTSGGLLGEELEDGRWDFGSVFHPVADEAGEGLD
jgi:hypothetical protein